MQDGWTALLLAASKGHVNVVQCLVGARVNLEAVDDVSDHCMLMYNRVIDAAWMHSIGLGYQRRSSKCSAMLSRGGS